jgi:hypothetical protein
MATTDDLVLLDRAVSNYHKAELFPAELWEPSEQTPGSWFGRGIQTFRCGMFDHHLVANGAMATGQSQLPLLAPASVEVSGLFAAE